MAKNKTVKIGVIGVGNMGSHHVKYMHEVPGAKLTAIADRNPEKLQAAKDGAANGDDLELYSEGMELVKKADVDAILIATPHYDHPPLTLEAFKRGLHVLCEKPVAVTAAAADKVNKAYARKKNKPVWGAMFQQRTNPVWRKVKSIIANGEIGQIKRVNWIITSWFRSQAYYNSGGWRATWAGEGGGVLINQCPHNLDLVQWFVGMPNKVTANVGIGKFHEIEVEDDVTALLEYPNGATGVFVTSTGESPGTNRLEITGDEGKIITDGKHLELIKTHQPVSTYCATTERGFGNVPSDKMIVEVGGEESGHKVVTVKFVEAIVTGDQSKLIAHASEGINGLELGNAMLMSGLLGEPVKIPTPRAKYEKMIKDLAAKSKGKKPKPTKKAKLDMGASF